MHQQPCFSRVFSRCSFHCPALGQDRSSDRWVASWATALVARRQGQGGPGGGRGQGPAAAPAPAPRRRQARRLQRAPSGRPAAPPAAPAPPGGGRGGFPAPVTISNQTIRQVVRVSMGGERLRVVLSNAFGTAPVDIGAAHVALRDHDAMVKPSSVKPLTFGGSAKSRILPGATIVSDAVDLEVPAVSDLVVDLYLPGELGTGPSPVTTHNGASQTNYLSGDRQPFRPARDDGRADHGAWFLIARVEVAAKRGRRRNRGVRRLDHRWRTFNRGHEQPLAGPPGSPARRAPRAGGCRAERRHQRQPGARRRRRRQRARTIRSRRADADRRDARHRHGRDQRHRHRARQSDADGGGSDCRPQAAHCPAHARGLKIYGATLTPFEGAAYFTAEGEAKRQALNQWIRTSGATTA